VDELELWEELSMEEEEPPQVTVVVAVDQAALGGVGEVCRDCVAMVCVIVEPQVCEAGTR